MKNDGFHRHCETIVFTTLGAIFFLALCPSCNLKLEEPHRVKTRTQGKEEGLRGVLGNK